METIVVGDVLGIANGRTIRAAMQHISDLPRCDVVQLTGMAGSVEADSVEVVRRVSAISGGEPHVIYAPLTVSTAATAAVLRSDPSITKAFELFPHVTIALVPVGSWEPPDSQLYTTLKPEERAALLSCGVRADIAGGLLDAEGRSVENFAERTIGIAVEDLRTIPQVVVIGGGTRKTEAIRSVLRSGLAETLVTDVSVARAILRR